MEFLRFIICSALFLLLLSCSTDKDDITPEPDFEKRLIKSTEGRNGLNMQYQNGLPVKALVLGYGDQDFYSVAMEIRYNENIRVARVIMDVEGNYPIEAGFDFNLD